MSQGVFTRMKRVTFVEKTAGEVGDGTDFPILVTLDQLAEIMYRVRKAEITTGGFTANGVFQFYRPLSSDVPEFTHEHNVTAQIGSGAPPSASLSITAYGTDNVEVVHGIPSPTILVEESGVWVEGEPPVLGSGRLSMEIQNLKDHFDLRYQEGPFVITYFGSYLAAREPIDEIAMFSFLESENVKHPDCRSAFNIICNGSASDPSTSSLSSAYGVHLYSSAAVTLIFRDDPSFPPSTDTFLAEVINNFFFVENVVAYTGSSPIDPAGNLYLRLGFETKVLGNDNISNLFISSNERTGFKEVSTTLTLSLKLSGGQMLSCPLFAYIENYQSQPNGIVVTNTLTFSDEVGFVVEATEWWPYAESGGAVWDEDTGLKL